MPEAQHTVAINRPPQTVFAYLQDGEKCTEWRRGVMDIRRLSGDGGVGTVYSQGVRGPMGRRIAADYRVTVCEPDRLIEFETVAGPARPHGRFEITPEGEGSRVTMSLDATMSGIGGFIMRRAVQRTMDTEVRELERMKAILEGGPPQR
jgi:uncharacterized protein YndB with AHSA1/START domain